MANESKWQPFNWTYDMSNTRQYTPHRLAQYRADVASQIEFLRARNLDPQPAIDAVERIDRRLEELRLKF